jgi:hypothetical protein
MNISQIDNTIETVNKFNGGDRFTDAIPLCKTIRSNLYYLVVCSFDESNNIRFKTVQQLADTAVNWTQDANSGLDVSTLVFPSPVRGRIGIINAGLPTFTIKNTMPWIPLT